MSDSVAPLLQVRGIRKRFFGVEVLKGVDYQLEEGKVLGLVGENGAGKSTLMNILGGGLQADDGVMRINGRAYRPKNPLEAEKAGIGFIHQELNLFPNLSIAENLFISGFPRRFRYLPFIDRKRIERESRRVLEEVGLDYAPSTPVEQLSVGERQLVEIAKALRQEARLIIFDEPTTSLSEKEIERMFAIIARLKEQKIAMIYISHNLHHIMEQCDQLLVLRDGARVDHGPRDGFSLDSLVTLMVGRTIQNLFPNRKSKPQDEVVLDVRGVTEPNIVKDVSFKVKRGEVLGVSGLMGSGRSELMRILFGLDPCSSGSIRLKGRSIDGLSPSERVEAGLAFLTEDRRGEGLAMDGSIADNMLIASLPSFSKGLSGSVNWKNAHAALDQMKKRTRISDQVRIDRKVKTLSGGNQQKVVLAKWLLNDPELLILDEPTRGIDVGAKYEIYGLIDELASRGKSVLVVSSEMEELIGVCDRIIVMSRGTVSDEIEPHEFDRERILKAAIEGKALS